MQKFLLRFLLLMTLLTTLVFSANAAETACAKRPLGTYNGQPACMYGSYLHLCKNNFPDDNFRKYLQQKLYTRNELILTEASDMPIVLNLPADIRDLTGIEFFPNLQTLYISHNRITTLDLSKNTTLTNVSCTHTQLTSINLSNLTNLVHLNCSNNYRAFPVRKTHLPG